MGLLNNIKDCYQKKAKLKELELSPIIGIEEKTITISIAEYKELLKCKALIEIIYGNISHNEIKKVIKKNIERRE